MAALLITYAGDRYLANGDRKTLRKLVVTIRHHAKEGGGWAVLPGDDSGTALLITPGIPIAIRIADPDDDVQTIADLLKSEGETPRRLR